MGLGYPTSMHQFYELRSLIGPRYRLQSFYLIVCNDFYETSLVQRNSSEDLRYRL